MPKKPNATDGEEGSTDAATKTWEDDQRRREYYYDDAHGYQKYEPDEDDDATPGDDKETADGPEKVPAGPNPSETK